MPLAVLVTLVGVTLSAGVSTLVVGQIKDSRRSADGVAAVAAAQAGLDAGLAKIRSAVTSLSGDIGKLPCSTLTPAAGSGQPDYQTSIGYFLVDPSGLANTLAPIGDLTNLNQLAAGTPIATLLAGLGTTVQSVADQTKLNTALQGALGCVSGVLQQVPRFGLLRSTGNFGGTTRTLYATYTFRNTEETIPGGRIVVAQTPGATPQLCIGADVDAGGKVVPGVKALAVPCTDPDFRARMIYPRNLSLSLADSRTSADAGIPYGLCATAVVQITNAPVTFAPCSATKTPSQQWQYEVNQQTYFGTLNGSTRSGYCLSVSAPVAAYSPIVLKSGGNCGMAAAAGKAFVPDSNVGSGAAGVNTGQLVNYEEVGRCLDLTNEDPDGKWFTDRGLTPALITYPCKQDFAGAVYWNHRWTVPVMPNDQYLVTGQISTLPATGKYAAVPFCLKSPGASGGFVWVEKCSVGGVNQQWTMSSKAPLDSESYQVVDASGNCLTAAGLLNSQYKYSNTQYSEVITAPCDNSGIQKWNKPRALGLGPLTAIKER